MEDLPAVHRYSSLQLTELTFLTAGPTATSDISEMEAS